MTQHPISRALIVLAILLLSTGARGQAITFNLPPHTPASNIIAVEYFFDSDPGYGNALALTGTVAQNITISQPIPTTTLTPGVHYLFFRCKDQYGKWSTTNRSTFYIVNIGLNLPFHPASSEIIKAEYFIDTDPGFGNGINIPLTSGTDINLTNVAVNISNLTNGHHKFYLRAKDGLGRWSISNPSILNVFNNHFHLPAHPAQGQLVKAEYFFNTDPGFGNGIDMPVTANDTLDLANVNVAINTLATGAHKYYVRTKDEYGRWSLNSVKTMDIVSVNIGLPISPTPQIFAALEYFVDTDPGFGNGTVVPITATNNLTNLDVSIPISGLADGNHNLFFRTVAPTSITSWQPFTIGTPLAINFADFSVRKEGNDGILTWQIANPSALSYFEVERSVGGKDFEFIGMTNAAHDPNWSTPFHFKDSNIDSIGAALIYYRIKAVAQDGHSDYSVILSLRTSSNEDNRYAFCYPNPVRDKVRIRYNLYGASTFSLTIADYMGKILRNDHIPATNAKGELWVDLSDWVPGVYCATIATGHWKKNMTIIKE